MRSPTHCWGVAEHSDRDTRGQVRWVPEARWSEPSIRAESRPSGFRYRRPDRGPRVVSFTDLGWDPS
jgi:hypothetical protein